MKTIGIACKVVAVTGNALLIHDGTTDKEGNPVGHWIPKAQCDLSEVDETKIEGNHLDLEVSEWLAKERGLI